MKDIFGISQKDEEAFGRKKKIKKKQVLDQMQVIKGYSTLEIKAISS